MLGGGAEKSARHRGEKVFVCSGDFALAPLFADFFGRIADTPLAVLEVECRSMGAPRCRFLVGNAAVMEHVYDEMGRGVDYEEAVGSVL